jgi:hypothetical protein
MCLESWEFCCASEWGGGIVAKNVNFFNYFLRCKKFCAEREILCHFSND